ncbi:hypothetical protein A3H38_03660 [candidate division WOR-1 bacterium RIFCSPLOWO2_02_FULL_46_20]|uniref:Uncharacterized protein n=2 Tax=Saganbacteria TaxID=1703751 RepID=A0A1F4R4N1_UNCSA|nr:MAG: hypothetical protein A3J44_00510 [candidate division WOR-1 bacterium RIFCSPHIGHO2_02_FULL_45_12]OGC03122.1 MAG: hypothetical protein A3H38_03660 [candidate division WOR-1 bacterium RIFCSPLOWO2_02_FULL_46_20]OGC08065.1 MAG: hypothetical protein A3F86_01645 [candidate division WOR-1 bacterium RIFCSPLOWO2_12_FULL_45_9]
MTALALKSVGALPDIRRHFRITSRRCGDLVEKVKAAVAEGILPPHGFSHKFSQALSESAIAQTEPNDQQILRMIEEAFFQSWVAVGRLNISIYNLYQVLGNRKIITFNFESGLPYSDRQELVLNTLGWVQPETENVLVNSLAFKQAPQMLKFLRDVGLTPGRKIISIGYGMDITLEIIAAVMGGRVAGFDADKHITEVAKHFTVGQPIIGEAIRALNGEFTIVDEWSGLAAQVEDDNLVMLLGVLDDPSYFGQFQPSSKAWDATRLSQEATRLVGERGDFLLGVLYIDEGSIFSTDTGYVDFLRSCAQSAGLSFAEELTGLQDGYRRYLHLFKGKSRLSFLAQL